MFGFLNIYKPVDITSHDVISYLRKLTKIKQIGHVGTLDPFAQGVLPVAVGKATRLIEYLADDKSYTAELQFGKSTDTYDKEGQFIFSGDKKVCREEVLSALEVFKGDILQKPPMFSAIKHKGKKLYEYAREGKTIDVEPRQVNISRLDLVEFDEEKQIAKIFIECSKGTYIRSIANDLGENLGCGAYLTELIRNHCGKFNLENTVNLYDLKTIEDVEAELLQPLIFLDFEKKKLTDEEHQQVIYGNNLENENFTNQSFIILVYGDKINAVAQVIDDKIILKKVFNL